MLAGGAIKRHARHAELPDDLLPYFPGRPASPTYLQHGGIIEHAEQIANHESPRTTKLSDRMDHAVGLEEIKNILT